MFVSILYFIILTGTAALFSWLATGALVRVLPGRLMDVPNARSNHAVPVPKGGGIAVVAVLVAFLLVSSAPGTLCFALLLLAVVSFLDDRRDLPARWRLMAQAAAVLLGVLLIDGPVFQGVLPLPLDRALAMFLWLWMINLTNFMDGIDGITTAEVTAVGGGILALCFSLGTLPRGLVIDSGLMIAATLGFAWWNRHPAKIFLGDAGSVPLGFLLGFLLLTLAAHGQWAAALILPAYYVTDATLTLAERMVRGQVISEAHSQHAYQRAVRAGRTHDAVVTELSMLNVLLCVLAVAVAWYPASAVLFVSAAYAMAFMLVCYLSSWRARVR